MIARLSAALSGALFVLACPAPARQGDSAGLIDEIEARLRTADSATLTLEQWCADHRMASPAIVTVERDLQADRPASAARRALLDIGPDTVLRYRKVRLVCGDHILSEAENWYVPARLTGAMNAALESSEVPFGKVIRPLGPTRRAIRQTRVRLPAASDDRCAGDRTAFSHEALVLDGSGTPLALVEEHYKLELACAAR
jgi:chorismate-pyruvate lyase